MWDPDKLAVELYANNVIAGTTRDQVIQIILTRVQKNTQLLTAVESQLYINPNCFEVFLCALRERPTLDDLCRRIEEAYCKPSAVKPPSSAVPARSLSDSDSIGGNRSLSLSSASESELVSLSGNAPSSTVPSRTNRFPYLDMGKMSERQKFLLVCKLFKDCDNIMTKFGDFVHYTIVSLNGNCKVTVRILSARVASLGAYKPVRAHTPLLRDRLEEIRKCTTIDDVFLILQEYYSFFNYGLIRRIITWFPTPDDERRLNEYTDDFKEFCKRRAFECPPDVFGHVCEDRSTIVVKTEDSWDPHEKTQGKILDWVIQLQYSLAEILEVETETLYLCQIDKGCVELLFTAPSFIAEDIFPLSVEQERSLVAIEVAKLTCGSYSYLSKCDDHDYVRIKQVPPLHRPVHETAAMEQQLLPQQFPASTVAAGSIPGSIVQPSRHPPSMTNQMSSGSSTIGTGNVYSNSAPGPVDDTTIATMEQRPSSVFSQSSVDTALIQNLIDQVGEPKPTVSPPLQPVVEDPVVIAMESLALATPRQSLVDSASNAQSQMNKDILQPLLEHPQPVYDVQHPSSAISQSTDMILECSICVEQYGQDFDHTPRVLRCGHTFCTKCLTKLMIMTLKGAKCPMCNKLHPLDQPNVLSLPPNYAIMQLMTTSGSRTGPDVQSLPEPDCEYCSSRAAEKVCIDCSPGNQVKFCGQCDPEWHNRPFAPVQRHRRYPINQLATLSLTPTCSVHSSNQATCYSLELNQFACAECTMSPDWSSKKEHQFEPIEQAVSTLRTRAQRLNQYSQDMVERLSQSERKIYQIIFELARSVTTTKNDIQVTFSGIIDAIQERQQSLMRHVDSVFDKRRQKLEQQLDNVRQTHQLLMEDLTDLLPKPDGEFLQGYRDIGKKMEELTTNEVWSLRHPVAHQVIPFSVPQETLVKLRKLGTVGGGATVQNITCISSVRNNLMQLTWELPRGAEEVVQYQIEYEYLPSRSIASIRGSGIQYDNMEPKSFEIPGNVFTSYVDDLCPGYMYRFRMRSASAAGWGMWSDPSVGTCDDFPITVGYTKKIHRMKIPISGHYCIEARGAKAKDGLSCSGGSGAIISATFPLKTGDTLTILTGGMSSLNVCDSGGGGGTFVVVNELSKENLLIAAGGGGGTRGLDAQDENGCDASLETWGTDGCGHEHGKGGKDGGLGEDANKFVGPCWGYGGAGFLENSSTAHSFLNGGAAGQYGGFGGGGATGQYGGGGGGGYSGGGGGRGGGGGGSYVRVDGTDVEKKVGNDGHGNVRIEQVLPLYPSPVPFDHGPIADAAAGQAIGSNNSSGNFISSSNSSRQQIYSPPSTEQHSGVAVNLIPGSSVSPSRQPPIKKQMSSVSSTVSTGSVFSNTASSTCTIQNSGSSTYSSGYSTGSSVASQSSVPTSLAVVNLVGEPKPTVSPPLQPVEEEMAIIAMDPTSALGTPVPRHDSVDSTSNAGSQVNRDVLQHLLEHPQPVSNAVAVYSSCVRPYSNAAPVSLGDLLSGAETV